MKAITPIGNIHKFFTENISSMLSGYETEYIYEYEIILNGQKIKADDCFTTLTGRTECVVNGITYQNVPYSTKFIGTKTTHNTFIPIVTWSIILIFLFITTKDILEKVLVGKGE